MNNNKSGKIADGDASDDGRVAAVSDGQSDGNTGDHAHEGEHERLDAGLGDIGLPGGAVYYVKAFAFLFFLDERFDDLHPGQFLLDEVRDDGKGLLPLGEAPVQLATHETGHESDQGHRDDRYD